MRFWILALALLPIAHASVPESPRGSAAQFRMVRGCWTIRRIRSTRWRGRHSTAGSTGRRPTSSPISGGVTPKSGYSADALYWEAFARYRVGGEPTTCARPWRGWRTRSAAFPQGRHGWGCARARHRIQGELRGEAEMPPAAECHRQRHRGHRERRWPRPSAGGTREHRPATAGRTRRGRLRRGLRREAGGAQRACCRWTRSAPCRCSPGCWPGATPVRCASGARRSSWSPRSEDDEHRGHPARRGPERSRRRSAGSRRSSGCRRCRARGRWRRWIRSRGCSNDPRAAGQGGLRAVAAARPQGRARRCGPSPSGRTCRGPSARRRSSGWASRRGGGARLSRTLYDRLEDDELKEKVIFGVAQSGEPEDLRWLLGMARDRAEQHRAPQEGASSGLRQGGAGAADLGSLYTAPRRTGSSRSSDLRPVAAQGPGVRWTADGDREEGLRLPRCGRRRSSGWASCTTRGWPACIEQMLNE